MDRNRVHSNAESDDSIQSLFSNVSLTNLELSCPSIDDGNQSFAGLFLDTNKVESNVSSLVCVSNSCFSKGKEPIHLNIS